MKLKLLQFLIAPLFLIGCSSNDDDSSIKTENIEIINPSAVYVGEKLGYSNVYEFSSTVQNNTNNKVNVVVVYNLRKVDTKEIVATAESREMSIDPNNKKSDKVERQPKGNLSSGVKYELGNVTYKFVSN